MIKLLLRVTRELQQITLRTFPFTGSSLFFFFAFEHLWIYALELLLVHYEAFAACHFPINVLDLVYSFVMEEIDVGSYHDASLAVLAPALLLRLLPVAGQFVQASA